MPSRSGRKHIKPRLRSKLLRTCSRFLLFRIKILTFNQACKISPTTQATGSGKITPASSWLQRGLPPNISASKWTNWTFKGARTLSSAPHTFLHPQKGIHPTQSRSVRTKHNSVWIRALHRPSIKPRALHCFNARQEIEESPLESRAKFA